MELTTETLPEQDGLVVYEMKAIERVNPLREKLNELREAHKEFPDLNSAAGIKAAKDQIKSFRDLKGEVEKERKNVKAIINRLGTAVDNSYNSVWDEAEKEQKERDAKLKEFEAEKDRIANEKKEAEERVKFQRFATISKMGAMEIENHVVIGDFRIETRLIGSSTEDVWQNHILKGFKEQYDIIEAKRAEEKRLEQERRDKLRHEQEELQRQRLEFEKQQAELKKKKEEFEEKQREQERLELKRKQEEERHAEKLRQEKIRERMLQLDGDLNNTPVGWEYDGTIVINNEELYGFSDDDFNRIRDLHNKQVADNENQKRIDREKDGLDSKRRLLLKTIGIDDTTNYDFREMPESDWLHLWQICYDNYEKKKHEEWLEMEKVKKLQEEERERERIADLSEGQRWRLWKDDLAKFTAEMPLFSSKRYSKMKAIALEKFSEIQLLKAEKISSN